MPRKPTDLTGRRFGKLTVVGLSDKRTPAGRIKYRCICDCGNEHFATYNDLVNERIKSCGCATQDRRLNLVGQRFGKLTVLESTGERGKGKDRTIIQRCKCDCGTICLVSTADLRSGNVKSCGCLHRESLKKNFVEHVNVSKLQKNTLRSTNTSGVTGVWYNKEKNKWEAEIGFQKKRYKLGRYENLKEAARVRKEAETRLHGDFLKWLNDLNGEKFRGKNISGQRFGKLTALYPTGERYKGFIVWRCQCDCGNDMDVPSAYLTNGVTTQCKKCTSELRSLIGKKRYEDGTLKIGKPGQASYNRKDLTGRKFGSLTALYPTGEVRYGTQTVWHCSCDCGGEIDLIIRDLTSGRITSCRNCRVYKKRGRNPK